MGYAFLRLRIRSPSENKSGQGPLFVRAEQVVSGYQEKEAFIDDRRLAPGSSMVVCVVCS